MGPVHRNCRGPPLSRPRTGQRERSSGRKRTTRGRNTPRLFMRSTRAGPADAPNTASHQAATIRRDSQRKSRSRPPLSGLSEFGVIAVLARAEPHGHSLLGRLVLGRSADALNRAARFVDCGRVGQHLLWRGILAPLAALVNRVSCGSPVQSRESKDGPGISRQLRHQSKCAPADNRPAFPWRRFLPQVWSAFTGRRQRLRQVHGVLGDAAFPGRVSLAPRPLDSSRASGLAMARAGAACGACLRRPPAGK